jgi:hypothetical protein
MAMKNKIKNNIYLLLILIYGCSAGSQSTIDFRNLVIFPNCAKKSSVVFQPEIIFYYKFQRFPNDEKELNNFLSKNDSLNYPNQNIESEKLYKINSDSAEYFVSLKPYIIHQMEDSLLTRNNIDSVQINRFSGKIILTHYKDIFHVSFDSLKIKGVSYSNGNKEEFNERKGPTINFIKHKQ